MSNGNDFLNQFSIKTIISLPKIFGMSIDITNSSVFALLALVFSILLTTLGARNVKLIPERLQVLNEMIFSLMQETLESAATKSSRGFLSLVLTIFIFISSCNLIGMIPGAFTVTSHIIVNLVLSAFLILVITVYGLMHNGTSFLRVFLPHGVPLFIAPFIAIVEFIAYIFRSVSLSLRLTANMVAGHVMLKVIAYLAELANLSIIAVAPMALLVILICFEFFVAILQGYIFALLTSVYMGDIFRKH